MPKRTSLPSMFPPPGAIGRPASAGITRSCSCQTQNTSSGMKIANIAARTAQPCLRSPTISPNVRQSAAGKREDREALEEIRERIGVFERMRRVHIEEPASVGTQLLDDDLRRCRDRRRSSGHWHRRGVRLERLNNALRNEDHRADDRERKQDVERAPRRDRPRKFPIVSDRVAREAANQARREPPSRSPQTRSSALRDPASGSDSVSVVSPP